VGVFGFGVEGDVIDEVGELGLSLKLRRGKAIATELVLPQANDLDVSHRLPSQVRLVVRRDDRPRHSLRLLRKVLLQLIVRSNKTL